MKKKQKGSSWRETANPMVQASQALALTKPKQLAGTVALDVAVEEASIMQLGRVETGARAHGGGSGRCLCVLLRCAETLVFNVVWLCLGRWFAIPALLCCSLLDGLASIARNIFRDLLELPARYTYHCDVFERSTAVGITVFM